MSYVFAAVFGVLLVVATVIGIVTTVNDYGQRPSVGRSQNNSGVVLYGGR